MDGVRFRPVQTSSSSEQVVEQIRRLIQSGELAPGMRLPGERELAQRFGVSRPTVREAIQSLASLRLLEVRQGLGTFVSAKVTTLEDPEFWVPWLTSGVGDAFHLLEVREALAAKTAALAARAVAEGRAGAAPKLAALAHNLEQMAAAADRQDPVALEQLDLEFHALLAEMGENPYLVKLARSLNHVFRYRHAVIRVPGWARQSLEEHAAIAAAVRAGDSQAAAALMTRHMESTKARLKDLT